MRRACIYMETAEELASDAVLWQHTTDSVLDESLGVFSLDHNGRVLALTTVVAGVREDHAVRPLLARQLNFFSIDDNDMVTAIYVGGIAGLVFAANHLGYLAGHAAQNLVVGVHDHPAFLHARLVGVLGLITDRIHLN